MMDFHVVIRGRNCGKSFPRTFRSLQKQKKARWVAYLSLDNADQSEIDTIWDWLIKEAKFNEWDWELYSEHLGVAGNLYRALNELRGYRVDSKDPESIIAILDGDGDTLPKDALRRVAHVYEKYPDTLVTYGSYKKRSKGDRTKISQAYPKGADVRKYPWHASHLKTFRASLLEHVKPEWFQDKNGKWLQAASDVALMLPLMELAGLDRCRHIHEITYVWNDSPVSKAKRALQKQCEAIVRAKSREKRLP